MTRLYSSGRSVVASTILRNIGDASRILSAARLDVIIKTASLQCTVPFCKVSIEVSDFVPDLKIVLNDLS